MTDKELADKAVTLLDGARHPTAEWTYRISVEMLPLHADEFVRDPRVAMALIEKCQKIYVEYIGEPEQTVYARSESNRTWDWHFGESLPRTITEACVEVLS